VTGYSLKVSRQLPWNGVKRYKRKWRVQSRTSPGTMHELKKATAKIIEPEETTDFVGGMVLAAS